MTTPKEIAFDARNSSLVGTPSYPEKLIAELAECLDAHMAEQVTRQVPASALPRSAHYTTAEAIAAIKYWRRRAQVAEAMILTLQAALKKAEDKLAKRRKARHAAR